MRFASHEDYIELVSERVDPRESLLGPDSRKFVEEHQIKWLLCIKWIKF